MLDSKKRAYLRKLSQNIDSSFQIGKGMISKNLIDQLKDALDKNELIKISLLDTMIDQTADDKKEIADKLAKETLSNVVSVLGKKIVLYKRSSKKVKILFPEEVAKKEKEAKAKQKKLRANLSTIKRGKENKEKAYQKKQSPKKVNKTEDKDMAKKHANNKTLAKKPASKKTVTKKAVAKPVKKQTSKGPIRNIKKSTKRI